MKQNTMRFYFKNNTGKKVDDLHVVFENPDIEVLELGSFYCSQAEDKGQGNSKHTEVGLVSDPDIDTGKKANVSFQSRKHHDFGVKKWWWTKGNERVGEERTDPPLTNDED